MAQMVTKPWNALSDELKQFETLYNNGLGGQGIYVKTWPDTITARAGTEVLAIHLNRQTGRVNAHLGSEPLNLHMRVAAGELKVVWVFEGADPAEPADIALALGKKLADLSAGLVSDEPDS